MDKENQADKYVSIYEISGTIYEVETAFSGTETLNNKIIRLMLSLSNLIPSFPNKN